jgi:tRNA threonylcarbamoyladenosine biosynthesis protein TsaE
MKLPDLDLAALERAATVLGSLLRGGEVLLLKGTMGSGKTTFTRALAQGMQLDQADRVSSPSYTLCMVHDGAPTLVHVDLYRLGEQDMAPLGAAGFESLGLEHEELLGPDRVLVVEWAELWGSPPAQSVTIHISRDPSRSDRRSLTVTGSGAQSPTLVTRWEAAIQKTV